MYQFKMTIGDWSDDGHGRYEDFVVRSNVPVEQVREAHFRIKDVTGIDIESICSNYGEDEIGQDTVEQLQELGFEFENATGMGPGVTNPEEMARLWVFLLQKADPSLDLALVLTEIPMLHFHGFDNKKRHISSIGYGLFHS